MSARRPSALSAAVLVAAAGLSGCTSAVSMQPARDANDPLCAEVSVRLPASIDNQERRQTDAQATGAWGDPASVLLTCGVEPPGPTTLPCRTVDGVDWIIDDQGDSRFRVTTFGRTPAVEVFLDNTMVSSLDVLSALTPAVSRLPVDGECTTAPAG